MAKSSLKRLKKVYLNSNINKNIALYHALNMALSKYEEAYNDDVSWIKEAFKENLSKKLEKERKDLALGYMIDWLIRKGCTNKVAAFRSVSKWQQASGEKASIKTVEAAFTEVKKAKKLIGEIAFDKEAFLAIIPLILSNNKFPEHDHDTYKAYILVKEEALLIIEFSEATIKFMGHLPTYFESFLNRFKNS